MANLGPLIQLIKTALTQNDNNIRIKAEDQLIQYQNSNPSEFFLNCSLILKDERNDSNSRQLAGTVVSRLLEMKNPNNGKYNWDEVDSNQKEVIKQKVLSVLISPHLEVMKSGAIIIAAIATIELPREQWQDIIDLLANNCQHDAFDIKNASITTLGYICQHIKLSNQRINDRLSQQILGAIILGTRQNHLNLIQTSLKALEDSLCFLESLMHNPLYRDTVFEVFKNNFTNNIEIDATYQALFEFVKAASPYLGCYKQTLIDLTEAHLNKRDQTSVMNLVMWEIIGAQYADKVARIRNRVGNDKMEDNFLQSVSERLLPSIMKCLLILNKDEQDDDDLRASASKAIQSFVKVCDKNVIDKITNSVVTIINSEDPYVQQATVTLFSTICQYQERDFILDIFRNGFDHLFALLNSQNKIVVKNSLIGFLRLSEALPQVFLEHRNVEEIIQTIFNFMDVNIPEIRFISVQILVNISEGLKDSKSEVVSDDPKIMLTKVVNYFTENMVRLHTEQTQMNEKLSMIIMNIIMTTKKRTVIAHLIEHMMQEYNKIIDVKLSNSINLIEYILSIIHTAILSHKDAIPSNQLLGRICELIDFHIKNFGVEHEGLSLLGAVATTFTKQFESRIPRYWQYVEQGLQNFNDLPTFRSALTCVGDFARIMETNFYNYATQVMRSLLQNIKQSLDREIKLAVLTCIGDLILSMQNNAESYLNEILEINDICFQAVYQLTNNDKELQYVEELKSNIIELYSCLLFAVNTSERMNMKLFNHFGNIATFIVRTCDKSINPTLDYLRSCLFLIHDFAAFYWKCPQCHETLENIMSSNQIKQLTTLLIQHDNRQQTKDLLNFIEFKRRS